MKLFVFLAALTFSFSSTNLAEDVREGCFFIATVIPVSKEEKEVIVTSYDSRFLLKLQVHELVMGSPLLSVGDEPVFAIHSLAMIFPEDLKSTKTETKEPKRYMFFYSKTTSSEGSTRYSLVRGEDLYEDILNNKNWENKSAHTTSAIAPR